MVRMCKIDARVKEHLEFSPARESNIVVRGDTLDSRITEHSGKRSTNSAAFSVGEFEHLTPFCESIDNDKEDGRVVFRHNEVDLEMSGTSTRRS